LAEEKIILFILLLCSISIHEWAHAWVADKLGDPLPRQQGRVTLDPRSHIDPLGTIIIPLIMIFASTGFSLIGWGKPVQVSLPHPKTRRRDDILITLAGPFSNFAIALVSVLTFGIVNRVLPLNENVWLLFFQLVSLNVILFVFNLIPIPPLDGSHILKNIIRMKDITFLKFSKYGFLLLIVLINIPAFQDLMSIGVENLNSIFFGIFSLLQS
jgi:Zn-dependent protease